MKSACKQLLLNRLRSCILNQLSLLGSSVCHHWPVNIGPSTVIKLDELTGSIYHVYIIIHIYQSGSQHSSHTPGSQCSKPTTKQLRIPKNDCWQLGRVQKSRRRCCRCNGIAKCLWCACVQKETPCSNCLPSENNLCHNYHHHQLTDSLPAALLGCPATTRRAPSACSDGEDSPQLVDPQPLVSPSISTMFTTNIPTLHHVP